MCVGCIQILTPFYIRGLKRPRFGYLLEGGGCPVTNHQWIPRQFAKHLQQDNKRLSEEIGTKGTCCGKTSSDGTKNKVST